MKRYRRNVFAGFLVALYATVVPGCGPGGGSEIVEFETDAEAGGDRAETRHGPNRLAKETSPYLLLHAHNPVDWYPWGPEALAKAKREGKMIFLSVGYSSCHWCHVMERESFVDPEIAAYLNEHFVSIKVDREERPDVDEIYMTALQLYYQAAGSPQGGGWPMSMFLTPDARPFAGGTYFPPRDTEVRVGFLTLLKRVQQAWETRPDEIRGSAGQLTKLVKMQLAHGSAEGGVEPDASLLDNVYRELADQFDPRFGGFGYNEFNPQYPKFPEPSNLMFLLDRIRRSREAGEPDEKAEAMLVTTLEKMAAGGIRDHVGGGFHRYSTDRLWRIPHFEKMLYDNGQLATVYAEAYESTGRDEFRRVAEEIAQFVLREMTAPEGGFFSSLDAETDGKEGAFYSWTRHELRQVLDDAEFDLVADVYAAGEKPNFEGRHVLLRERPLEEVAGDHGLSIEQLQERLAPVRRKLLEVRNQRQRPRTDTKILTAWNGLMIRGLADAGRILGRPEFTEAAGRAAGFVLEHLRTPEGRLLRSYNRGEAKLNAYLDDYAFLIDGLIALHRATGERSWLDEARRLTRLQVELFWDEDGGGFFFTSGDHETLIARIKDPADSALPSGNAVAAGNLEYLATALDQPEYLDRAEQTLKAFAGLFKNSPAAAPRMAVSLAKVLESR